MGESSFRLTADGTLETPAATVLVFHNTYPEGKQGGIELLLSGERIATNGDLRLEATPGQWAPHPKLGERRVVDGRLEVRLSYPEKDVAYTLAVEPDGDAIRITARVDEMGRGGELSLNLELFPPAFAGRTYHLGDVSGVLPSQATGPMKPIATGPVLSLAPEDPERALVIESLGSVLSLLDGRATQPNGWFVVRGPLERGGSLSWRVTPHVRAAPRRPPRLSVSQIGYHPAQKKHALLEQDPDAAPFGEVVLHRIGPDGLSPVLAATPTVWGVFHRKRYGVFDFTCVTTPGTYLIEHDRALSAPFPIARDVYQRGVVTPTLDTFFPVQMCHMRVVDGSRVWHGACHLDDARQAPAPHQHFDLYRQGPTTDSPFEPGEHIPGLDRGGWHDAVDYDLAAGSQARTVWALALAREAFGADSDHTTVRENERLVILRKPDGVPDVVEQVAHGVTFLLAGYRAVGHSVSGVIERDIVQYAHLGDAATMTDNVASEDDRWAFTSHDTALEYLCAASLAAAARVLLPYDEALARECIDTAVSTFAREQSGSVVKNPSAYVPHDAQKQEVLAAVELALSTGNERYRTCLEALLPTIRQHIGELGWAAARVLPRDELRDSVAKHRDAWRARTQKTPFGVPIEFGFYWGVAWALQLEALHNYYLLERFPDLWDKEDVLGAVGYVLGLNPALGASLVSGVGVRSTTVAYGVNRADGSYVPGGVVSGPSIVRPDRIEYKSDFPYLWQQAEYVMEGAATYVFCALAADALCERARTDEH
jgi:endoglucanase